MVKDSERENHLAYKAGQYFDRKITSAFWSSFKGSMGRIQAAVLVYLFDRESGKTVDIAEELNVPKQHISKIILGFIEDGLVQSRPDPLDRRANILSLTDKGYAVIMSHYEESSAHFQNVLNEMTEEDRQEFLQALETIERLLQ